MRPRASMFSSLWMVCRHGQSTRSAACVVIWMATHTTTDHHTRRTGPRARWRQTCLHFRHLLKASPTRRRCSLACRLLLAPRTRPRSPIPKREHRLHHTAAVSAFDDEEAPEMMQAAADLCATNGVLLQRSVCFGRIWGSLLLGARMLGHFLGMRTSWRGANHPPRSP